MTLLLQSAIRKPPSVVAQTLCGLSSSALDAWPPSPVYPGVPLPATVVIVPFGQTRRITWLPTSSIRKPPSAIGDTPKGRLSSAWDAGRRHHANSVIARVGNQESPVRQRHDSSRCVDRGLSSRAAVPRVAA